MHYSRHTEEAYEHWIRDYVRFHGKRHPREMGAAEMEAFLSYLANARNVSASTHQQALSALPFLYNLVLDVDLPWLGNLTRLKKPQRLPAVLTREEVNTLLAHMEGTPLLIARLLYGVKVLDTIIFLQSMRSTSLPRVCPVSICWWASAACSSGSTRLTCSLSWPVSMSSPHCRRIST